ncbi:MAG TPA: cytochrome c [Gemmatimonadales bacterium]
MRCASIPALMVVVAACGAPPQPAAAPSGEAAEAAVNKDGPRYGLGRTADAARVAALDIDVGADGRGLPPGRGSVADGEKLYQAQCGNCHGAQGQGMAPVYPALIGREPRQGFPFGNDPKLVRTVGNYWSHATTLVDYVRRAMPLTAPGSLTSDQVYAVSAYILAANEIIPKDAVLDSAAVMAIQMPAKDRFVPDDRRGGPEVK